MNRPSPIPNLTRAISLSVEKCDRTIQRIYAVEYLSHATQQLV
ncbi:MULTISPECIES: hypothetical protein [unclassified Microcoleus]